MLAGIVILVAVASGCSTVEPATQVLVQIDAEGDVQALTDRLEIVVGGGTIEGPFAERYRITLPERPEGGPAPEGLSWPRRITLVPENGDAARRFEVVATAFDEDDEEFEGPLSRARVLSGYVRGRTASYRLLLEDACLRIICGEGMTCRRGRCVTAEVPPVALIDAGAGRMDATVPDGGDRPDRGDVPDAPSRDVGPPPMDVGPPLDTGPTDAGMIGIDSGPCPVGCNDDIPCTDDDCLAGGCRNVPNDTHCTAAPGGTCQVSMLGCVYPSCTPATCVANPCGTATCVGDDCVRTNLCTAAQMCCGTTCVPMGCDDGVFCTDDACTGGTCAHVSHTRPCDDGNRCTASDRCGGGTCTGTAVVCNDGRLCTDDVCIPATGCSHPNNTLGCDDGNACTVSDRCGGGSCAGGGALSCPADGNPCTTATCSPATGCGQTAVPPGTACEDGDLCTTADSCSGTVCMTGPGGTACIDLDPCADPSCDPGTGMCVYTPVDGELCDTDANLCTMDFCVGGSCVNGATVSCLDRFETCCPSTGMCTPGSCPVS